MALRWLFIDIGGPILDDGPLFDYLAAALRGILVAQGHPATGEAFQEAMERGWQQGAPSTLDYIIRHFVTTGDGYRRAKEAYWDVFRNLTWEEYRRFQILRYGVPQALRALSGQFQLATLSNNVVQVRDLMEEYGVAHFFSVWGISEEVGYPKPDPRLFRYVLNQAGCRPEEAMMVGDRLDNDILPAQKLGLATAQILMENNFGAPPCHVRGVEPDVLVDSLWELAQKLVPGAAASMPSEPTEISESSA